MYKEAPVKTERYVESRRRLIKHMADYTSTTSGPKYKEGVIAYLTEKGDVWLTTSKNVGSMIKVFQTVAKSNGKSSHSLPTGVKDAMQEGQTVNLFIGRPMEAECLEMLTGWFEARECLISRKEIKRDGPGQLIRITHQASGFYYLISSRWEDDNEYRALSRHLYLWQNTSSVDRRVNPRMDAFITMFAEDILNERGFATSVVGQFKDRETEQALREEYVAHAGEQHMLNARIN